MKWKKYGKFASIFIHWQEWWDRNLIKVNQKQLSCVKWDIEAWSGVNLARISDEREDLSANLAFGWWADGGKCLGSAAKPSVDINTKIRIKKEETDLVFGAWKSPPQRAREVENLTGPHEAEISWQGEITFRVHGKLVTTENIFPFRQLIAWLRFFDVEFAIIPLWIVDSKISKFFCLCDKYLLRCKIL